MVGVSNVVGHVGGTTPVGLEAMFPAPPRPEVMFRDEDERRPVSEKVGGRGSSF